MNVFPSCFIVVAINLLATLVGAHLEEETNPIIKPAATNLPDDLRNGQSSNPSIHYKIPDPPAKSTFEAINFFDNTNCHGSGAGEVIDVKADEFSDTACAIYPSVDKGMPHFVDLEGNGAAITIKGQLNSCQLHWYSGPGCDPKTWISFMTGGMQDDNCTIPVDDDNKPINNMRSFSFICDGEITVKPPDPPEPPPVNISTTKNFTTRRVHAARWSYWNAT